MSEALRNGPYGASLPTLGGEAMDLLFKLGPLTTGQLVELLPERVGERRVRQILAGLRAHGWMKSRRRSYRLLRSGPKMVHRLTEDGVLFVADRQDLFHRVATKMHNQVCSEPTEEHALFRTQFFADLASALRTERARPDGPLEGIDIEVLCAESGVVPIHLGKGEKGGRSYLNPDGQVTFVRDGDPAFHRSFFIEADTGSEHQEWKIGGKADRYGQRWASMLDAGEPPERLAKMFFLCPNVARTRWVREVFRKKANDPESSFAQALERFRKEGLSLASLVLFTNLTWLDRYGGPLGRAYWPLSSKKDLGFLLP